MTAPPGLGPEEVAELRRLEAAATLGEWKADDASVWSLNETGTNRMSFHVEGGWLWQGTDRTPASELSANAAFIAAARNALPALLASLDATAARVVELERLIRTILDNDPGELISDAGHAVIDLWRVEAARALSVSPDGDRPEMETKS